MAENLVPRHASEIAEEVLREAPVLAISGARQTGKSTLMRQVLADRNALILNLDSAATRSSAEADPDGFVEQNSDGILAIDEIQRVPALLLSIKNSLENNRRNGRFVITGSSNLHSLRGAEESLAGRAETLELRGLSQGELRGTLDDFAQQVFTLDSHRTSALESEFSRSDYLHMAVTSMYPEARMKAGRPLARWRDNYVQRVLSKDAIASGNLEHPDRLESMFHYLAAQGNTEFVHAKVGRVLGIPERSVPSYLKALQSVYLVEQLPAWGHNLAKRTVSRPKVFVADSGLASHFAGLDAQSMELEISSATTGGIIESFVAEELLKQRLWSTIPYKLFHFRNSNGFEVDLVLEDRRRRIVAVEVKATVSINHGHFKGIKYLQEIAGDRFVAGIVLYAGKHVLPFGNGLWALPISSLWQSFSPLQ